jgi:putative DNA-invertase from lambdoid prophage Rac
VAQTKAHQEWRGQYLGGKVPFGFRVDEDVGQLVPRDEEQNAITEMAAMRRNEKLLRSCGPPLRHDSVRLKSGRL